jgi:hypothetical protein
MINDRHGDPHTYLIAQHNLDEGLAVVGALLAIGGEPLGSLLQGALGKLILEGGGLSGVLDAGAADVLAEIDWAAVGRDLAAAVSRVQLPTFVAGILRHTTRDGQPLADPGVRNTAYRGNYGELYRAVAQVVQANHFFSF